MVTDDRDNSRGTEASGVRNPSDIDLDSKLRDGPHMKKSVSDECDEKRIEELQWLERLVNRSRVAMIRWSAEGSWPIHYFTKSFRHLCFGTGDIQSDRIDLRPLIHPDDVESIATAVSEILEKGPGGFRHQCRIINANGQTMWVDIETFVDESGPAEAPVLSSVLNDITESKAVEEALTESEQTLTDTLAASPVGIGRVEQRKLQWANPEMLNIFRFTDDADYKKKSARILYASEEEFERVGKLIYEGLKSGRGAETDAKFRRKDGTVFDGHIRISAPDPHRPMRGTIAGILDITERKQVERDLRESERRYRSVLETITDGYYESDLQGHLTFFNEAVCRIIGYTRDELTGMSYRDLMDEANRRRANAEYNAAIEKGGAAGIFDHELIRRDGVRIPVAISVSVINDSKGQPTGFRGICRDMTERKRAEAVLLQSERLKALGEMAGGVAHNFNNFLQIGVGGAQVALIHLELGNVPLARQKLEQILQTAKRGAETVKRLQDFARSQNDDPTLEGRVFDLSKTAGEAIEMSKPWWKSAAEKDGIKIEVTRSLETGCFVRGRENELFEVVVNFIKNAAEASPNGGKIDVACKVENHMVKLTVSDTGVGIAPEHVSKVFEPFWTSKGLHGTGMGLASSLGIVRRHGGDIEVDGSPGQGASFTVTLPRTLPASETAKAADGPPVDFALQILVVDDLEPVVKMLENGLSQIGQRVHTALSGKEAIEVFRSRDIDFVICDLGMEEMNGWQVGKSIKKMAREKGVERPPFMLLTGWGGQLSDDPRMQECGVDGIIEKPVDINDLARIIRENIHHGSS